MIIPKIKNLLELSSPISYWGIFIAAILIVNLIFSQSSSLFGSNNQKTLERLAKIDSLTENSGDSL